MPDRSTENSHGWGSVIKKDKHGILYTSTLNFNSRNLHRCNTDISFGKNCQLKTLLVLSGVTSLKQLEQYEKDQNNILIPDFYTTSLGDILDLLEQC